MLNKYEHSRHNRTRAWRRYKQDCIVKNRLKNDERYMISSSFWSWEKDGDIPYGELIWVDMLGKNEAWRARTSWSHTKSSWDYDKKYIRAKYKKQTKRCLWEEGLY